ncbi:MAG: hypothetical protein MSB96_03520, partial [Subdoligranulum sp.]|nr:hypothetical protein [Subdoligranulum sp.]
MCIIEHFGNADAVPQMPERCLSRKAGIVRCYPRFLTQNPAAFVEIGYILVFSDVLQSMLLPHAAQCAQGAHCLLAGGAL